MTKKREGRTASERARESEMERDIETVRQRERRMPSLPGPKHLLHRSITVLFRGCIHPQLLASQTIALDRL